MNCLKITKKCNNNKLILKAEKGQDICNREISIIDNNLEGLVPLKVVRSGLKYHIEYELTGKIPIAEFFSDVIVNKDIFIALLKKIYLFVQGLNRLHMSTDKVIWNIGCVYTDKNDLNPIFLYLPLQPCQKNGTLKDFFIELLEVIEFEKERDSYYLREFVDMLNVNAFVTELLLKKYIEKFDEDDSFGISNRSVDFRCPVCNTYIEGNEEICPACGLFFKKCSEKFSEDDKENSRGFCNQHIQDSLKKPFLHTQDVKILINHTPFNVGKDRKLNDYVIDSNIVSRQHAQIFKIGDEYYLIDFDSKNGTFLNEKQIKSGEKFQIYNQDKIRFADKEVVFIL